MASLLRHSLRAPRARIIGPFSPAANRRYATGDYGSEQSGHEQGVNQDNPKKHLEHPGPEPPSTEAESGPAADSGSKDGASPKIQQPHSAAEEKDEDVKKHNEDMRNRYGKTTNQLGEDDNKVNKDFWTGDVGDTKNKNG